MVAVSRICCGVAAVKLYPDNHFQEPCTLSKSVDVLMKQFDFDGGRKKGQGESCYNF